MLGGADGVVGAGAGSNPPESNPPKSLTPTVGAGSLSPPPPENATSSNILSTGAVDAPPVNATSSTILSTAASLSTSNASSAVTPSSFDFNYSCRLFIFSSLFLIILSNYRLS